MAECIGLLLTHWRWAVLWKSESADRCAANDKCAGSQPERHLFKPSVASAEVCLDGRGGNSNAKQINWESVMLCVQNLDMRARCKMRLDSDQMVW